MSTEKAKTYLKQFNLDDRVMEFTVSFATVKDAAGTDKSAVRLTIEELEKASRFDKWVDISIEKKISPEKIIEIHDLKKMCEWFSHNGAKALILGCTHFPYIYEELKKVTNMNIVEPLRKMIELLGKV